MQCPQISDETIQTIKLSQVTFDPLKNGLKIFISKTCIFFIRNLRALHLFFAGTYIRIWGHRYSVCIALQFYSALRFERLKRFQKSRAIPWEFWDEVFSLPIPSVCPHLTTVHLTEVWHLCEPVYYSGLWCRLNWWFFGHCGQKSGKCVEGFQSRCRIFLTLVL